MSGAPGRLAALVVVLLWILWAGLRPFDFDRKNGVAWIEGAQGLRFTEGRALSDEDAAWDTGAGPARFELEVELRPALADAEDATPHKFFVLFDETEVPALVLYQTGRDLVLADRVTKPDGERWYNDFRVPDLFEAGQRIRLRVSGADDAPRLFADGAQLEPTSGYGIPIGRAGEALAGRILLGADPKGYEPWAGDILGLTLRDGEQTLASYAFAEGGGSLVENGARSALDLHLPAAFRSLRPALSGSGSNTYDLAKNLLGFVPLGFLLAALLGARLRALLLTLALGFLLSLGIELAQTTLISRVSSLSDLRLNTLGTLVGALLAWCVVRPRAREPEPAEKTES